MPAYNARIEELAQAITTYTGYLKPDSILHAAKNPGGIRATSMRHTKDENNNRVFGSFLDGYQSLLFDLQTKLSGKSWAELTPESTLEDLAVAYSLAETTAAAWAKFLRAALKDSTISSDTPLSYFTYFEKDTI